MNSTLKAGLAALVMLAVSSAMAMADVGVFKCRFTDSFEFYITVYDDGSPARIGVEQGVGNKAQAYFDKPTGSWVFVEFIDDGKLPSTLTTILKDGSAWHSRHTLSLIGRVVASHMSGVCNQKIIN